MSSLFAVLWSALSSFALLALVFTPLERAFPARPEHRTPRRSDWLVDAAFFAGQYLVWSGVALAVLSVVRELVAVELPAEWLAFVRARPIWVQCVIAVVAGDLLVYWFHRACHRFELLWRFHEVHHSSTELDWLAAHREHPVDGVLTQLCQNLPAFLLGLRFEWLAAFVVLRSAWAIFIHSNVRLPLGPLRFLLGAPELHHFHHARVVETRHNFANLAPWLDLVFGTYHRPTGREAYPLGLTEPWPSGYFAQLAAPFLRWPARPSHLGPDGASRRGSGPSQFVG